MGQVQPSHTPDSVGRSDPATLTAAIEMLVPLLHGVVGVYSKLALLAGTLVEWGGSPLPLCDVLPRRAAAALQMAEIFPGAWQQAAGGEPPPDRADLAAITATRERLVASAAGRGIPRQQAELVAWSWFEVMDWGRALITAMTHREFRAAMEHRDWVRDAARAMADQLHTLLADRLSRLPAPSVRCPAWRGRSAAGSRPPPTARCAARPPIPSSAASACSTGTARTSSRKDARPTSSRWTGPGCWCCTRRWLPSAGPAAGSTSTCTRR
jgi:hypothetical protein